LWDLRLVDPDNRGPIDFTKRAAALDSIVKADFAQAPRNFADNWRDGCIKLYLIWKAIRFRRDHDDLFRDGEFIPIRPGGANARNVIAFLRKQGTSWVLAAIPRWLSQVPTKASREFNWSDTKLTLPSDPPAKWNSILTRTQLALQNQAGEQHILVNDLFREFPVALLHAEGK